MREVDPKKAPRAGAFALWMHAPMPMVTLIKTLDVSPLMRAGRKRSLSFHMLLCWCIGKAAWQEEAFYLLPVGDRLMAYDHLAVSTVVATRDGGISTCDVPFSRDLAQFQQDCRALTRQVHDTCRPYDPGEEHMVIGTSALAEYEIDGAVNLYAGCCNNPFLIWGKYRRRLLRTTLPVSFQFHHTQMDGVPAAAFLDRLQHEIRELGRRRPAERR